MGIAGEGDRDGDDKQFVGKQEIPFALREYGEIPKGFVPLYITVKKESLDHLAEHGFMVVDNRSVEKHGEEIERIFSEAGKEKEIKLDRKKCIYALPRPPHEIKTGMRFKEDEVLVEVMVDPSNCIVVDGERFTEATLKLHRGFETDVEDAEDEAKIYWDEAKSLKDYLAEDHNDASDFQFPEVLIPFDIPTSRIKVVDNYRSTKND